MPLAPPASFWFNVSGSKLGGGEKTFLEFACNNGYLSVLELQLEGKKKMNIVDFLRGYRFI